MTWDEMVAADPDVVVCMPCGYDLKRTREEMHWHDWSQLQAQVYLADGNQYLDHVPGRVWRRRFEIMAEILYHGVVFTAELRRHRMGAVLTGFSSPSGTSIETSLDAARTSACAT